MRTVPVSVALLLAIAIAIAGAAGDAGAEDPLPASRGVERKISGPAIAMAASRDGKWLAVADAGTEEVVLFSTSDDRRHVVARPQDGAHGWRSIVFTDDSAFLVAAPFEGASGVSRVSVIDVATAKEKSSIDCPAPDRSGISNLCQVAADPGGSKFLLRGFRTVEVWDAKSGERQSEEKSESKGLGVFRTPDPRWAIEDRTKAIALVDVTRGLDRWTIDAAYDVAAPKGSKREEAIHDRSVWIAGLTGDGRFLVLQWRWKRGPKGDDKSGEEREVTVHSMRDGKPVWKRRVDSGLRAVAAGDGVVAIGAEEKVEFVDAATGKDRGAVATPGTPAAIVPASGGRAFWVNVLRGAVVKVEVPATAK